MTIEELVHWAAAHSVPLSTQIAIRSKDDYLLTEDKLSLNDHPYFGNCNDGYDWLLENVPKDEDGDIDFEKIPQFLLIDID